MSQDDLEKLPGVGPATADKLVDSGYETYEAIAVENPNELSSQADIGESTAYDVVNAARDEADIGGFNTGVDVLKERQKINKTSTGVGALDDLLGGGIETQCITEIYGKYSSGKSQMSHQLAINAQLPPEHGGTGQNVIFIDTEDTFRPNRIEGMVAGLSDEQKEAFMEANDVDGEVGSDDVDEILQKQILDGIQVAKGYNSSHQMLLAEKSHDQAEELEDGVGMLIVDSLTAHFRAEYVGRGELAERQQKLNKHLHTLKEFASLHNASVFVTNQVAANPDSYFGDPTEAIGGNILAHSSTVRMYIKNSKNDKRIIRLVDSPDQAEGEAVVRITDDGVKPE